MRSLEKARQGIALSKGNPPLLADPRLLRNPLTDQARKAIKEQDTNAAEEKQRPRNKEALGAEKSEMESKVEGKPKGLPGR